MRRVKFGSPSFEFDMSARPSILAFGRNLVEMDALIHHLNGFKASDVEHIELVEQVFGACNRQLLGEADGRVSSLFKLNLGG